VKELKLRKTLTLVILAALVVNSSILLGYYIKTPSRNLSLTQLASAQSETKVYVDPANISGVLNDIFAIDVKVENVMDLYGVNILFSWDPSILEYVSHTAKIPVEDYPDGILHEETLKIMDMVDAAAGTYWLAYASMAPAEPFDGSGIAFNMTFKVVGKGSSNLELDSQETKLSNSKGNPIEFTIQNGQFNYVGSPTAEFSWWPDIGVEGKPVMFNASQSYDPDGNITNYYWDFGDGTTANETTPTINHTFTQTQDYTVSLIVQDDDGTNSSQTTHQISITTKRNIKIIRLRTPEVPAILVNTTVSINCTVLNDGTLANETFTISVYYNTSATKWKLINSTTETNLPKNKDRQYTFYWNTTGVQPEKHYLIKANTTTVPHEQNTTDNTVISKPFYLTSTITHDIKVTGLTIKSHYPARDFSPPIIRGEDVKFEVGLQNIGTVPVDEEFSVKIFSNGTLEHEESKTLKPYGSTTLVWIWKNVTEVGIYTISVEVAINETFIDDFPDDNHIQKSMIVVAPPELNITYTPLNPHVNDNVTLDASGSVYQNPQGQLKSYTWQIYEPGKTQADVPTAELNGTTVSYIFSKEGNWTVVLTSKDNYGLTYNAKRTSTNPYTLTIKIYVAPAGFPLEYIVIPAVIIVAVLVVVLFYRRKRKP